MRRLFSETWDGEDPEAGPRALAWGVLLAVGFWLPVAAIVAAIIML